MNNEVVDKLEALIDVCQRLVQYVENPGGYGFMVAGTDAGGAWTELVADEDLSFLFEEIKELVEDE